PRLFGQADEIGRHHEAAFGMVPADQALGADDRAAGEIGERLVMQRELAAVERAAQRFAQRAALREAFGELIAEEAYRSGARAFGAVERGACVVFERVGVVS